jgi:sec-independent protein translocase protein TatA
MRNLRDEEHCMLRPEPFDIVIIILVALLLFGANRLPETARAMGKGIREFKDALAGKDSQSDTPISKEERLCSACSPRI